MGSRLDNLLNTYRVSIHEMFTNELVGIYLTGSLAFGEFYEGKSDADLTVLLKSPLDIDSAESVKKFIRIFHRNIKTPSWEANIYLSTT